MEEYSKPTLKRLALKPTATLCHDCWGTLEGGGYDGYYNCRTTPPAGCFAATPGSG